MSKFAVVIICCEISKIYFDNKVYEINTFYCLGKKCLLYDALSVGHMVKNHSGSERVNPMPSLHGLLFPISSKGSFIMHYLRHDSTYNSLCYTSCGALAVTRSSAVPA